jgi:ribosome-binding factor A
MESKRQQRIARLLQKDLGEIFQHEAQDLTAGAMVTVTKVCVTSDLAISRVYLSIFGTDEKQAMLNKIREYGSKIKYKLGNRIRKQLRTVPNLEFYEDDSLDYIDNIERLLK